MTCGGEILEYTGIGTERVEAELVAGFPGIRLARVDRDTIRRRGEITRVLDRFARRDIDVLVGTQMIAKGHDFPAVTLVGVISADVGLGLADFRAAERTFQLLTQVAGRAGRGEAKGEAIVQTLYPEHYSIRLATTQDYEAFFEREMRFRASMRYPPSLWLVNIVVRHASLATALKEAGQLVDTLKTLGAERFGVLGPAPAPARPAAWRVARAAVPEGARPRRHASGHATGAGGDAVAAQARDRGRGSAVDAVRAGGTPRRGVPGRAHRGGGDGPLGGAVPAFPPRNRSG